MSTLRTLPWAKFGFEGVLIIVSILAAFWIDSWRDDRQFASEEQALLRQLESEFETNSALLEERRTRHMEMLAALQNLLAATGPNVDSEALSVSQVKRDLYVMLGWWTYDPHRGALDSIIQSGKLGIIKSDQLRAKLASWPALMQDFAEDEVFIASYTRDFLYPLFQGETVLRDLGPLSDTGLSKFSWDVSAFLASRQFENVVQQKFVLTQEILGYYDDLQTRIDETVKLIQEEVQ